MLRKGFNGKYCYERLRVVGQDKYKDVPEKNEFSHVHDAKQYSDMHYAGSVQRGNKGKTDGYRSSKNKSWMG